MSQVLNLYKDILESNQRFVDEIFTDEIYQSAVPKLTIVDLGAFEGEFSFYCYNFANKIYAVEPDPRPYAILERRVKEYELDKIKIFPIGISGETSKRTLYASGEGGSHLTQPTRSEKEIEIETMNISEFFTLNNIAYVDILKVDIEGAEEEIFNGSEFAKVADKVNVIIGEHLDPVKETLIKLGFKCEEVEGRNLLFKR